MCVRVSVQLGRQDDSLSQLTFVSSIVCTELKYNTPAVTYTVYKRAAPTHFPTGKVRQVAPAKRALSHPSLQTR